jgi:O-antigen ligase
MRKFINYLIYLFVFLLPWQTRFIFERGILNGEEWEYGTKGVYGTEVLLGLILVLSIVYFLTCPKSKVQSRSQRVKSLSALGVFIIAFGLNCLVAIDGGIAFYRLGILVSVVAFGFVVVVMRPEFVRVAWAVVYASIIQGSLAINQFITNSVVGNKWLGMSSQDPSILGVPAVEVNGERILRAFGSFPHPNILAGFLIVSLFLIIYLYTRNKKMQKMISLVFVINFMALLTTLSRGAIVAFVVGLVVMAFFVGKDKIVSRATTKFAIIAVFILVLFTVSFPGLMVTRSMSTNEIEVKSNEQRMSQYSEFAEIYKNNWVYGVGIGNYTLAKYELNPNLHGGEYQPIHNTYLLIIAELGLMGVAIILLFVFYILNELRNYKKWSHEKVVAFSILVALMITGVFDHYAWDFWSGVVMLALVIVYGLRIGTDVRIENKAK